MSAILSIVRGFRRKANQHCDLLVAGLALFLAGTANAVPYYWTGNANGNWNSTANWSLSSSSSLPHPSILPGMSDTAVFNITPENADNGIGQTIQLNSSSSIAKLQFDTARDSIITGATLSLYGDTISPTKDAIVMNAGSGNVTIASTVQMMAQQRWVNSSTSVLKILQPFITGQLTIAGTGDTVFAGNIDGNSLNVTGGTVKFGNPDDIFDGISELNSLSVSGTGQFQMRGTNYAIIRSLSLQNSNNLSFQGGYLFLEDAYGHVVNNGGALLSYELVSGFTHTSIHGNYTQATNGIWWSDNNQPMAVDSVASLDGRLILLGAQSIGSDLNILTAGGGVTGEFNSVLATRWESQNVALRVTYLPNSVRLQGVAPSNAIQYIATTQTANWSQPSTWSTGQLPGFEHNINISNLHTVSGIEQVLNVDVPAAKSFRLTVEDASDPIRVRVQPGRSLAAQAKMVIGQNATIEMQTGSMVDASRIEVRDGGRITGTGSLAGWVIYVRDNGRVELSNGTMMSEAIIVQTGGVLSLTNVITSGTTNFHIQAGGTVELQNTSVFSNAMSIDAGGVLVGSGSVEAHGTFVSNGTISPGDVLVGSLDFNSSFSQTSSGEMLMDISDASSGGFDTIEVTGSAQIDGALTIDTSTYETTTEEIQHFDIFRAASLSGEFDSIEFTGTSDAWFVHEYLDDAVRIHSGLTGDLNGDGDALSDVDIDLFVFVLMTNPSKERYHDKVMETCPISGEAGDCFYHPSKERGANFNGTDDIVDFNDIPALQVLLGEDGHGASMLSDAFVRYYNSPSVPEPSSALLCILGGLMASSARHRQHS